MGHFAHSLPVALVVVLLAGVASPAIGDEPKIAPDVKGWEGEARKQELTEKEIKHLREHKFLVTDQPLKQVFSAYIGTRVPVFVTSDSILNGYHVLFEESIYRLELANARKLPGVLDQVLKNLDRAAADLKGDEELTATAKNRAAIFMGVARNLLDDKVLPDDRAMRNLVQAEVKRTVAGAGVSKPEWLGPADPGFVAIDYSRFKPRGLYTRSPALQRYFRAVAWLQAIPFRLEKDDELAAFLLMRRAYGDTDPQARVDWDLWSAYQAFLGDRDDWDFLNAWRLPKELTKDGLDKVREEYRANAERDDGQKINDQLRFAPTVPGGKAELAFRFLSAFRLPDGAMFQRTMRPGMGDRKFPSGLEVAAVLGSPFARDRLVKEAPKVLNEIDAARGLFNGKNLYAEYMRCLGTLLERTEPDAPEFMSREAWRTKTCQSALASWAQMRHTWALQAKIGAQYVSSGAESAGFVEPVPEFYGQLARLVDATRDVLAAAGALGAGDEEEEMKELVGDLRVAIGIVKKAREKKADLGSFTQDERSLLSRFDPLLDDLWDRPEKERQSEKMLESLERILGFGLELAELPLAEARPRMASMLGWSLGGVGGSWNLLSKLCHRLEVLAHKQLRQIPFNKEENEFLRGYGKLIARVMFYSGNSYFTPRDDAMRVVDIYSNPLVGQHLHIGIARPRMMWVLYPTKEGEVLCRGAILPYAEFAHPTRLTDADWKSLLDSQKRPKPPDWVNPIIPPERPLKK